MSIEWVMLSSHLILCHPHLLLRSYLPSIRVFSNVSALRIRWQKYWSFSISPSCEYSGLIFFRIDWLDLLGVQGAVKTLIQHHTERLGKHYLPLCVYVCVLVAQLCPTLLTPQTTACQASLSIHGILQTRILEWVATIPPLWQKMKRN